MHYKPVRDREGNVIYESENVVKQEWDPLDSVTNYMDDILVTSTLRPTYAETVAVHFQNVEQAVERLAFHGAKINVMKWEFLLTKCQRATVSWLVKG